MTLSLELSETFEQELKARQDHLESLIPKESHQILRAHFRNGVLTSATSYLRGVVDGMRQVNLDEFDGASEADFAKAMDERRAAHQSARKAFNEWVEFLNTNGGPKLLTGYLRYTYEVREIP